MDTPDPRSLSYATGETEQQMDLHSRERAMLARMCRTLGPGCILLGLLAGITVTAAVNGRMGLAAMAMLLLPGIVLWTASAPIRMGSRAWCVTALLAAVPVVMFTLLGAIGAVIVAVRGFEPATQIAVGASEVLLCGLTCLMIHYAVQVLLVRGRAGGDKSTITDLRVVLAEQAVHGATRRSAVAAGIVSAAVQIAIAMAGGRMLWLAMAVPPPPVLPPALVEPAELLSPFNGDVYWPNDGLPAAERREVIAAVEQFLKLSEKQRMGVDLALADRGQKLCALVARPIRRETLVKVLRFDAYALADPTKQELVALRFPNGDALRLVDSPGYWGMELSGNHPLERLDSHSMIAVLGRAIAAAAAQPGAKLTNGQARALAKMLNTEENRWRLGVKVPAIVALPDEMLEINDGSGRQWLTPGGKLTEPPAVIAERQRQEAQRRLEQRVLPIGVAAPAALAGSAALAALASLALAWRGARSLRPAGAFALPILTAMVMASGVWVMIALSSAPETHWLAKRLLANPLWLGLGIGLCLTMTISGIWIPLTVCQSGTRMGCGKDEPHEMTR